MFEKSEALDIIQMSNEKLAIVKNDLYDKCDKLSKEILLSENRWDFLLKIQVYTYKHEMTISTDPKSDFLIVSELLLSADGCVVARRKRLDTPRFGKSTDAAIGRNTLVSEAIFANEIRVYGRSGSHVFRA